MPQASLVQGNDGNFYGTTYYGGATSTNGSGSDAWGTIFEITPSGTYTLLYSFTGGADGTSPAGALVQGTDGNFYGTTSGNNGQNGNGTIFRYKPGATAPLTTFTGAADGGVPMAGLVEDDNGNFYGTTSESGTGSAGTVFMMNPDHVVTTLYAFCGSPNCTDGSTPLAPLLQGADGNFYGTTSQGGTGFSGTIFKVTPAGVFTSIYSFCLVSGCPDGSKPAAALIQGSDGSFYGTTPNGGGSGFGTTFRVTSAGVLNTPHSFAGTGVEGGTPLAALVLGSDGNFYGTTEQGGTGGNDGTVFQMDPAGDVFSFDLYSVTEGFPARPVAGLVEGPSLNFYGTTPLGGTANDGTVFQLTMGGTISGTVTLAGSALPGVTMTLSMAAAGTTLTDASGHYSFSVAYGGTYLVTPILSGYSFTPPSAEVTDFHADTTLDFTAAPMGNTYTISGNVSCIGCASLNVVPGVTMTLSGSVNATTTTDSSGNYTFTAPAGGAYTVTPTYPGAGYTFTPPSATFTNLNANQTQNFTATTGTGAGYTISGQVTLSGVGLSGVSIEVAGVDAATTNSSGNYTLTEPAGGNYTLTPSLFGYSFSPSSASFNNLNANATANFTASATVSGGFNLKLGLTYTFDPSFMVPSGSYMKVEPHVPGYTIAPFGSQNDLFTNNSGTLNYTFVANPYPGLNFIGSMPQLASGGGRWTTTLTLLNTGSTAANVALNFYDNNGNPLALPLTFPQGTPLETTASFTGTIQAGAVLVVQTAGLSNPLAVGWAELLSDGDVSGFEVFTDNVTTTQQQQAVVPLQNTNLPAYLLYFDNTNGYATAVALANVSTQPATITLLIKDDTGKLLSTNTIQLSAHGHTSFVLAANYPATGNLRGTLEFDEPAGGQVSVLGLAFNPASAFTSIPAVTK
jgi:uncharacterized repeat protein (TIGR03803 family)